MENYNMIKRLKKDDAILVVIDFQEKLMPAMAGREEVEDKAARLIRGCRELGVPVVVTQQYTRGLGQTVPAVAEALGEFEPIEKVTFSCCSASEFNDALEELGGEQGRNSIIIIGCETHICVEQTALDLMGIGYNVFLVADGVQSRSCEHKEISLRRMEAAGAVVTNYESVLYEMLMSAKAPQFKAISAIVK
jgi:nicotinamidase-related amidase